MKRKASHDKRQRKSWGDLRCSIKEYRSFSKYFAQRLACVKNKFANLLCKHWSDDLHQVRFFHKKKFMEQYNL